ncbi:MAG: S8 family serine peptidase, partial [Flavobacteriales bacterium]
IEFDDPVNGIDDDNNGFIDDYLGWNFGDDNNDPSHAISSHGTQMAGLVIATNQNNTGLASACYNVPFFVSKITKSNGDEVDPYIAVIYAVDRGAKLINCSWYQTSAINHGREAIDYAEEHGVLLVAAAGNLDADAPVFPASDPRVLSVGALNQNSEKSSSSNYGPWVDVFAPGVQVRTTAPNNSYILSGGTSSACAITSSALGFLMKVFPDYTPDQLIQLVKQTGRPLSKGKLKNQVALDLKQAVNQNIDYQLIDVFQTGTSSKHLQIHVHSGFQETLALKAYNLIGQLIYYQRIENPIEAQQFTLPASIQTGIYLIELSGGGERKSKKIHVLAKE